MSAAEEPNVEREAVPPTEIQTHRHVWVDQIEDVAFRANGTATIDLVVHGSTETLRLLFRPDAATVLAKMLRRE